MRYTVRPLSDPTWAKGVKAQPSRFTATWADTLGLLAAEVRALDGKDVVLGMDVQEKHIRQDGQLRSGAKAESPAVEVAFESKHGPLLYRCARFRGPTYAFGNTMREPWQHNIRAIALTLQALRAVDRYGASGHGEQYTGYKAIGTGTVEAMTVEVAKRTLLDYAGDVGSTDDWPVVLRRARAATHPDRNGGDRSAWNLVEACNTLLRGAGYLR
jgi:hypothetical protein